MTDALVHYSSAQLRKAYADGAVSPVEVAEAALARIGNLADRYNVFSFLAPEDTLQMARRSEERWRKGEPLGNGDGIPVTIKDNMSVAGWPRQCGSLTVRQEERSQTDSACVARLREAGCIFLGKTTTPEFAWKGVGDSPLNGVSRNPWRTDLTPGGSSSGAAIAALLDMGVWHTASDAAGSIRIPSAFCGVQGFKPTFGIVPNFPASAFSSLGHHGPLARNVTELAEMMAIISRPDSRDATAAPPGLLDFRAPLEDGLQGKRIGYFRGDGNVDPEILEVLDRTLRLCEDLGAVVDEIHVDFADAREQIECYWRVGCALLMDSVPAELRPLVDPGLAEKGRQGKAVSGMELRAVQLRREDLASSLNLLHDSYDFVVTPVVPIQPFQSGRDVPPGSDFKEWIDWAPFSYPFNLTHQPTASVTCGLTRSGLPTAMQIVGRRFSDRAVLAAAAAFEQACPPVAVRI